MSNLQFKLRGNGRGWTWLRNGMMAATIALVLPISGAQQPPSQSSASAESKISPDQAKQLFGLVDELIQFSSQESGLPIQSTVKRQITDRTTVENYLKQKFEEDESAKRMQRGEIVLKKFGLLDRDFNLKPFLLALLKEQIEAYYEPKTKTVTMLDWVTIEEQKPVLAHELTHALQDQHSDLEKWDNQSLDSASNDHAEDSDHLARDEMDSAREAVVEGQATAVMMDYMLKPIGKSLTKNPEIFDHLREQMSNGGGEMLARAPLLLSESMLFPYRDGLGFEQDLWMDQGQSAAFAGTLDRPPTSTWEIFNPRAYEHRQIPAVPLLPNIHPLVDKLYKPYDIGQVGQLDLKILATLFGGESAARLLTPAWDGGIYWAGQQRSAKSPSELASTHSIALFYLAAWKNAASAQSFARLYAKNLGRKYSGLKLISPQTFAVFPPLDDASTEIAGSLPKEQVYSTHEGPVVILTQGKLVFISESFDLDLARKLGQLVLDAQGSGQTNTAQRTPAPSDSAPAIERPAIGRPLTGDLVQFFARCGVMKAAVDAGIRAAAQ